MYVEWNVNVNMQAEWKLDGKSKKTVLYGINVHFVQWYHQAQLVHMCCLGRSQNVPYLDKHWKVL